MGVAKAKQQECAGRVQWEPWAWGWGGRMLHTRGCRQGSVALVLLS